MDENQREEILIAVATHKPYRMPKDSCYIPLHVGAAMHPGVCSDMQQDDNGENISAMNASYSELTGLFWVWKNCSSKYKGLVHYRRHFRTLKFPEKWSEDRFERIACSDDFRSRLVRTGAQVIVPRARNYVIESIESHYRHTLPGEQLDAVRESIASLCPDYL